MLNAFRCDGKKLHRLTPPLSDDALQSAVWIDLVAPSDTEVEQVARVSHHAVPTKAALSEIETSSRLNFEEDVFVLSMPLIARDEDNLRGVPAGFILSRERLITIRFAPHLVFDRYAEKQVANGGGERGGMHLFVGLMEALVDRFADGLEQLRAEMDGISSRIFGANLRRSNRQEDMLLRETLRALGRVGDTISLIRDSQVAAARIIPYVARSGVDWLPPELKQRLRILRQDVDSLSDFDTHLNDKLQFLLDATLGFINIAQNNVMKVMTVASVAGIPPVLIAGIYGMNFKNMPELDWSWGYPYSLVAIAISTLIPLAWFKWRDWI
ncbi:MAG: magnesium transporter CorA family protein [Rhodospirillales bacterium]|nr:magnesium transporter CorA family protein [Rhodospirillales bacterium]